MSELFDTAIVAKRNVLNEIRSNNMTVQELRFFSIYLSKINPWDKSTRVVRFPLEDFRRIMEFGRLNISQLKSSTDSLLCKIVHVPDERGGYRAFQLFKECHVSQDDYGEWYMEIDAHDRALPLMFDFRSRYFKYKLWNALRLKSSNQVRMYEILKQYEGLGKRELTVAELRELLGIAPNEYTRFERFRVRVLDSCQSALKESTDICFEYERGKTGKGGKWITIIFYIRKNNDYIDQLTLDEFINMQPQPSSENDEIDYGSELADLLGSTACKNEFTPEQIRILQDLVIQAVPNQDDLARCDYLIEKVHLLNYYHSKNLIQDRFAYLRSMIEKDIKK